MILFTHNFIFGLDLGLNLKKLASASALTSKLWPRSRPWSQDPASASVPASRFWPRLTSLFICLSVGLCHSWHCAGLSYYETIIILRVLCYSSHFCTFASIRSSTLPSSIQSKESCYVWFPARRYLRKPLKGSALQELVILHDVVAMHRSVIDTNMMKELNVNSDTKHNIK